jgi:anthranilate synthase/aminodeoxychorismate synthase-like glutamine amidotransferase
MILVIDNYDSFTYNLVHLVGKVTSDVRVRRNDQITLDEIGAMNPSSILISPGPGRPEDAGVCVDVIRTFGPRIPLLGVCLGHQAIGYAFGGKIIHAPTLMHGKTSAIHHDACTIFEGLDNPFTATRYHSLVLSPDDLPPELTVTARTSDGVIMGVRHTKYPIEGVQFHPESILTTEGEKLINNWLKRRKG